MPPSQWSETVGEARDPVREHGGGGRVFAAGTSAGSGTKLRVASPRVVVAGGVAWGLLGLEATSSA